MSAETVVFVVLGVVAVFALLVALGRLIRRSTY